MKTYAIGSYGKDTLATAPDIITAISMYLAVHPYNGYLHITDNSDSPTDEILYREIPEDKGDAEQSEAP